MALGAILSPTDAVATGIAKRLGITEGTVKAHLGRIFRELGVVDRTSAALWARDHGFA